MTKTNLPCGSVITVKSVVLTSLAEYRSNLSAKVGAKEEYSRRAVQTNGTPLN